MPGVPSRIFSIELRPINITEQLIAEEVLAQVKIRPVSCRMSRHGANTSNGKATWIVSFATPAKTFRLFGTSEYAKLIDKKPAITRHNPGCQGFCNPAKCTRYARCEHCGTRADQHPGPIGANCTENPRCVNCHGPFAASHDHCPAAPKRHKGKIVKLTKKELDAIRRHGDQEYRLENTVTQETPALTPAAASSPSTHQPPSQATGPTENVRAQTAKRPGSQITEYEEAGSSQMAGRRPRRMAAPTKSLNAKELSKKSAQPPPAPSEVSSSPAQTPSANSQGEVAMEVNDDPMDM